MSAMTEVRAILEAEGLGDRLPGLVSRWDQLAEDGLPSASSLRLASVADLVDAGFHEHEAQKLVRALGSSDPGGATRLGASRPASPGMGPMGGGAEPEQAAAAAHATMRASHARVPNATDGAQHRGPFRYTPVTAMTPAEFPAQYGAKLLLNSSQTADAHGTIESLIVITMYNESAEMLDETLDGICDNIMNDCKKNKDPNAWKRWAVCIVADGRQKMNAAVAASDIYDGKTATSALELAKEGEMVSLHMFEGTRERPRKEALEGMLQTYCCCCRSRHVNKICCCARKAEPDLGDRLTAGQGSVRSVQIGGGGSFSGERLTCDRAGPQVGGGDYTQGPGFIEHQPTRVPGPAADASLQDDTSSCFGKICAGSTDDSNYGGSVSGTGLQSYPPLQMIFAVKEENAGKLDSHLWFFDAFADSLRPDFCFLVDVGTVPGPRSLVKLRDTLKTDAKVAGCCGQVISM